MTHTAAPTTDAAALVAAEQQQPARFTPHVYRHRGGLGDRSSWRWTATVRHDGEHYETVTIAEAGQPWILDYPTKAAAMAAAEQRCAKLEAAAERPAWDVLADADADADAEQDPEPCQHPVRAWVVSHHRIGDVRWSTARCAECAEPVADEIQHLRWVPRMGEPRTTNHGAWHTAWNAWDTDGTAVGGNLPARF